MTLYSADLLDLAKPVESKKKGGKKGVIAPPPTPAVEVPVLTKTQETKKRKKEEAELVKAELEKAVLLEKEKQEKLLAEQLLKKEALKEKRRLAREAKKLSTPPDTSADGSESLEEIIDSVIEEEPPKKRQKIQRIDPETMSHTPPAWFKQYVAGVKKEEAKVSKDKKPQRQIQQEANEVAEHQWQDGFTRDRVRNEVDNHMSRMYQMMFSGRRLK